MKSNTSSPKGELALTPAQRRLWVLYQLDPENVAENVASGVLWKGPIDIDRLGAAMHDVLERYEILRSEFRSENGEPLQRLSESAPPRIVSVDLRHNADGDSAARLSELETGQSAKPFDLSRGPLLRLIDVRLSESEHKLILVTHRIVCDRASARIVLSELLSSYSARLDKRPKHGNPPQYEDVVAPEASASELSFWTTQLTDAPSSLDLPTDRPRPALQTFSCAHQHLRIEPSLVSRLRDLSQRDGKELFSALLAGFATLLHRYSRQEDMVLGTRVSGRKGRGLEQVVGPLENMLALRVPVVGDPSFGDFLHHVHDVVENALAHQGLPFESVLAALRLERDMHASPGREAHPWAQEAAADLGISLTQHRAKLLTREMVSRADCVFAMDFQNKAELLTLYPEAQEKILMLSAYAEGAWKDREIPDPYLGDVEVTRHCGRQLQICIRNLLAGTVGASRQPRTTADQLPAR